MGRLKETKNRMFLWLFPIILRNLCPSSEYSGVISPNALWDGPNLSSKNSKYCFSPWLILTRSIWSPPSFGLFFFVVLRRSGCSFSRLMVSKICISFVEQMQKSGWLLKYFPIQVEPHRWAPKPKPNTFSSIAWLGGRRIDRSNAIFSRSPLVRFLY